MDYLNVPKGKILKCQAGGYTFVGPIHIPLDDKFIFPPTYLDGSPLEFGNYETQSNSNRSDSPPSSDTKKGRRGPKTSGSSKTKLPIDPVVRKGEGSDNGAERVHGERNSTD